MIEITDVHVPQFNCRIKPSLEIVMGCYTLARKLRQNKQTTDQVLDKWLEGEKKQREMMVVCQSILLEAAFYIKK